MLFEDPYFEYLNCMKQVAKARRRNDPRSAAQWARIAQAHFNQRRWKEEIHAQEEAELSKARAEQEKARKKKQAEFERWKQVNPGAGDLYK